MTRFVSIASLILGGGLRNGYVSIEKRTEEKRKKTLFDGGGLGYAHL
jgi:hypothetical protein